MSKMIHKNTTIPTKFSQIFSTAEDNQQTVTIKVFQGDGAGALYAVVCSDVPPTGTAEERKPFQRLTEISSFNPRQLLFSEGPESGGTS